MTIIEQFHYNVKKNLEEAEEYVASLFHYKEEEINQALIRDGYTVQWDLHILMKAAIACMYVTEAKHGTKSREMGGIPHTLHHTHR